MDNRNDTHRPVTERPAWHHAAAATWLLIDVGTLVILVVMMWLFSPKHGILPGPTWLVDPVVGWVIGNIVGVIFYKPLMRFAPWVLAAVSLLAVALSPVVFVKDAALGGFVSGLVIGVVGGACYWRAHTDAPGPLL